MKINKLYWKISAILLGLLVILGVGYILITSYTSGKYFQEVNQRLYGEVAEHLVKETQPLVNGLPDTLATHDIMHSMMVINPSVEVYLLDTVGRIIDYVVPYKKVKREEVNLQPVKDFIAGNYQSYILGDDPKNLDQEKVFSAAPVLENGKLTGYAYIILASEEQTEVVSSVFSSYILKLGTSWFFLTLIGALLIGLLAFWLLMNNLRKIIENVRQFKEGNFQARIASPEKSDLSILGITFNEMADKIEANIEELKSVDKLRQELIANVSHDLRTPLAIMQGYIETMQMKREELSDEDTQKYMSIVLKSSDHLSKLISQLFEYSKLEANQIQPQKEPFFISELAQDIYGKYQILAQEKNIKLYLEAPQDLPLVLADVGLVERAIHNLMDNALKFTPEGGKVGIELFAENQGVRIKISDTGPGIPEAERSYIFDRYRRSDDAANQSKNKGAGLGLAIVKKILEIQNSSIQVQSIPNQGATFWFSLPFYQGAGA